jgi:hypothetical protein
MARLEILDELEEWYLIASHYCVAWAYNSDDYTNEFSTVQLQEQQPLIFNK